MDVSEIIPEMEESRSAKLFVDILYHFAVGLSIRLAAANEMKALNLGPSAFQVSGSTTSTPSPHSFSPQFASKVVAGATPPLQVQGPGQGQGLGQGSVCPPAGTESERLQAAYHAQQQHLRHHQQQLKQRAVTHPSLLGPLTDINTGQTFNRDPNGALYRSGRHGSCEEVTVGPSVQRAFDYDAATQEFAHRDALRLLDQTGQRSSAQDRKYSQYQAMNYPGQGQGQGQLFQGGLGFGSQQTQQTAAQSTPSSPHESLKGSHTQQQQQADGYLSPFSFNRSTSGPQLGTRHTQQQQQQQQQQSIHGLGQGQGLGHGQGQGQGPSSRHQSQQQQQLQLHLQQQQMQQQQQQQHAIHSRGAISGAPSSSLGLIQNTNRGRSRDGPGPTRNQQTLSGQQNQGQGLSQSQGQHLHGLHGVMGDFEYDDPHTNPYLGGIRSLSPGPSSRTSSNVSMNGDYAGDFSSFGGSLMSTSGTNSRGYDLGDVLLRLGGDRERERDNEDYTVGNVSRRPSYTINSSMNSNSSPRPGSSDISVLLQQQQHDTNYEGYEAHLNARRVTSPRQSDQISFYDSMGVPSSGNMAGAGTGSVGQGQGQSPGPGGGGGGI